MSFATETPQPIVNRRRKRADARRNYAKLVVAAREAFKESNRSPSLEDIARRAGLGIGTLYRHFPARADLIAAACVEDLEELRHCADGLRDVPPWEALVHWLRRVAGYAVVREPELFETCRQAFGSTGEQLIRRAQEAGCARPDVSIDDVMRMVAGIAQINAADPAAGERILGVALDGLRYRAAERRDHAQRPSPEV
jgi:AcrR family transcriptional regulator